MSAASEYGLLLDIDSGNVGAAIVSAPHDPVASAILWSIREELPLRPQIAFDEASKDLRNTIQSVCKKSGSEGVRTLTRAHANAYVGTVLVRIAAP